MDHLYFYLTLYDNDQTDEIALNHGFFWSPDPEQAYDHITALFAAHYQCDPSDIQCRLDTISPAEILRLVSQRLRYDELPLRIFGIVVNLTLPENQRDLFINIAMAESAEELQSLYHTMLAEKFPNYNLSQAEMIIDEYQTHEILSRIADTLDGNLDRE